MFKSKKEKISFVIITLIVILLFIIKFSNESELKRNGIFVLGHFNDKSFGSESGWVYSYSYTFHDKKYTRNFNCIATEQMKNDSLLFFLILKRNPEICRQLPDIKVPKCLSLSDVPKDGWTTIPECK